jgi:tRNA pseudouridine38-40 synthase
MRIRLTVEYDGTNYAGWQRQKNAVSVQEMLERSYYSACGETVSITGAGRTDAGVHALAQVAHFDTNSTIPAEKISFAMNMYLPEDIRARRSEEAAEGFHARFDAKGKTYRYTIHNGIHAPALQRHTAAHVRGRLDVAAMRKAARYIIGTHDFACFCASGSEVKSTVRTVHSLGITEQFPLIHMDITGSGFLYHMARIITGTLIDTGHGKLSPKDMREIIDGRDRNKAGATAPAQGLTLIAVYYTPNLTQTRV